MKPVYFDISDIVDFAKQFNNVTGIQRVQQRVIAELAGKHPENVFCTFLDPITNKYFMVSAVGLFEKEQFNGGELLTKLRLAKRSATLTKADMKSALRRYEHNKPFRSLKKAELYASAYLFPSRLKHFGIAKQPFARHIKPLHVTEISSVPHDGTLVFLGANWHLRKVTEMGQSYRKAGGRVIQMIYDLIPYTDPKFCVEGLTLEFNRFLNGLPEYATDYMCISNWSRKDLTEFLLGKTGVLPHAITVPLAHEFSGFERNSDRNQPPSPYIQNLLGQQDFVACVGTIEIRKNGANLLRAWRKLIAAKGDQTPKLVFAGKKGWHLEEFEQVFNSDPVLQQHVTFVNAPSDCDLAWIYNHARFSVFPSFTEGWGLPVGEAAWFGKYCLASNATSVPEVCGDLIDYVNPSDVDDMTRQITFLLDTPEYIAQKEQRIRTSPLRTWATVAEDVFNFAQRVASENRLAAT